MQQVKNIGAAVGSAAGAAASATGAAAKRQVNAANRKLTPQNIKNAQRILIAPGSVEADTDGITRDIDYAIKTMQGLGESDKVVGRPLQGDAGDYMWGGADGAKLAEAFKYIDGKIALDESPGSGNLAKTYLMRVCAYMKRCNEALMNVADRHKNAVSEKYLNDAMTYLVTALQYVTLARFRTAPDLPTDSVLDKLETLYGDITKKFAIDFKLSNDKTTENYRDIIADAQKSRGSATPAAAATQEGGGKKTKSLVKKPKAKAAPKKAPAKSKK